MIDDALYLRRRPARCLRLLGRVGRLLFTAWWTGLRRLRRWLHRTLRFLRRNLRGGRGNDRRGLSRRRGLGRLFGAIDLVFPLQTVVPQSILNGTQLAREMFVALLVLAYLGDGMVAVAGIQGRDQLGQQMLVLGSFLDGGQAGAGGFALPRWAVAVRDGLFVLVLGLQLVAHGVLQQTQVQVAQSIGAQAVFAEAGGALHGIVAQQQVGDAGEDLGVYAIASEGLEQQERLERRVV